MAISCQPTGAVQVLGLCDRDAGNVERSGEEPLTLVFALKAEVRSRGSAINGRVPTGETAAHVSKPSGNSGGVLALWWVGD